ncbi:unnamed protein product [Brassica oleracea var. botrytis]
MVEMSIQRKSCPDAETERKEGETLESDEISEEVYLPLKESIGHTEVEVIAGALFGKRSKSIYSKSLCIWERRREMQVLARNLAQRVSRSQEELVRCLERDGFKSIQEAIGADHI